MREEEYRKRGEMEADLFLNSTISEFSMGCKQFLKLRASGSTPDTFKPLIHLSLLHTYPYPRHNLELALVGIEEGNIKYAGNIPVSLQAQVELSAYENIMQM